MSDDKLFKGLKTSIQDAGRFLRGEDVPELTLHTVSIMPVDSKDGGDVRRLRKKFGLSQGAFAAILGVSRKTIEAWEHGGSPSKPVSRLLQLIENDPSIIDFLVDKKRKQA